MRIINQPKYEKPTLPNGVITARWVQSRALYQVYVGGRYLSGATGSSEQEALENARNQYQGC